MKGISIWIRRGLLVIEWLLSLIWMMISWLLPRRKSNAAINVYNAIRLPSGYYIFGRVLDEKPLIPPRPEDSSWINFKRMLSQWMTRELPNCEVLLDDNTHCHQLLSDNEGYVKLYHETTDIPEKITLSLPKLDYQVEITLLGNSNHPQRIIISDIDDTLIETGAVSLFKMVKTTIFGNALTREIVAGTPALLRDLSCQGANPIFYITSSPWNLANFLKRVFKRANLPEGGLFMTDWGLSPEQWLTPSHSVHKGSAIRQVAQWFPHSSLILLGDDSQKDPEIYLKALDEVGIDRCESIFIRNVAGSIRASHVQSMFDEVNKSHHKLAHLITQTSEIEKALEMRQSKIS